MDEELQCAGAGQVFSDFVAVDNNVPTSDTQTVADIVPVSRGRGGTWARNTSSSHFRSGNGHTRCAPSTPKTTLQPRRACRCCRRNSSWQKVRVCACRSWRTFSGREGPALNVVQLHSRLSYWLKMSSSDDAFSQIMFFFLPFLCKRVNEVLLNFGIVQSVNTSIHTLLRTVKA